MALSKKDKEELKEFLEGVVDKRVNGKIDRLDKKLDAHLEEIEPMLDFLKGVKVTQKVTIWFATLIASVIGAYVAIKGVLK